MTTAAETLMQGLRNAHAMEKQAIESMENQIDRLHNYPEMQAWVRDHVESSKRQRERVRQCLERHGTDASTLKDMALSIMGNIQELTGSMASDEVLKNAITDYGFKHYEIAAYVLVLCAALIRVFGGMIFPDAYLGTLIGSGICWSLAFALYAIRYWPVLSRARLDGKPG